jgi:hypothetical protein
VDAFAVQTSQSTVARIQPGDLVGPDFGVVGEQEANEEAGVTRSEEEKDDLEPSSWYVKMECETVKILRSTAGRSISVSLYIYRYIQNLYATLDLETTVVVV